MKKFLSGVLILTLCFSFVACGSQSKADTVGEKLRADFIKAAANKDASAQEIVDAIIADPVLDIAVSSNEVEEGLLTGFDNVEFSDFLEAVQFGPMISGIPFIGYVFVLDEEDGDADGFVKALKDNANPRWNVCTEADEVIAEKSGNKVFFLMCPKSFDEEE